MNPTRTRIPKLRAALVPAIAALILAAAAPGSFAGSAGIVRGSADAPYDFRSIGTTTQVFFTPGGVVLDQIAENPEGGLKGHALRIEFPRARTDVQVEAFGDSGARMSEFRGSDPSRWRQGVPIHEAVVYRGLWPGVDLRFEIRDGELLYTIEAATAADASRVELRLLGATRTVARASARLLESSVGEPIEWHEHDLGGVFRWSVLEDLVVRGKSVPGYWGTFVGGSQQEEEVSVRVAANGDVILGGYTLSSNFPTTPGAYDLSDNDSALWDGFVCRFDNDGQTLLWSTYLGGSANDQVHDLLLDPDGGIWFWGSVTSSNWPTTPGAYDVSHNGSYDGALAKLSGTGSTLEISTFLGGSGTEFLTDVAFDAQGDLLCVGYTSSSNFPTSPGAHRQAYLGGQSDAFVARLSADGSSLPEATYVGGSDSEILAAVVVTPAGEVISGGHTYSNDLPIGPGAFQSDLQGVTDAFVVKLGADLSSVAWMTYVGGSAGEAIDAMRMVGFGEVALAGHSDSADFPVSPNAVQTTHGGNMDAMAAKMNVDTGQVLWATYVGGSDDERFWAIAPATSGALVLAGQARSSDYPVSADALDPSHGGGWDAMLTVVTADGSTLAYSTYLGGALDDFAMDLDVDAADRVYVSGQTGSSDFPVSAGAYDSSHNGSTDAFVASWPLQLGPINLAPLVAIDPVLPIALNTGRIRLRATVSDEDSPNVSLYWCKESGPGAVEFDARDILGPRARFDIAGVYVLKLTARDEVNTSSETVQIEIPPTPSAHGLTPPAPALEPLTKPREDDAGIAADYYAAIDPTNSKDTLAKWFLENGLPSDIPAVSESGAEECCTSAVFFNAGDLGLGRRMVMNRSGGDVAYAVTNYGTVDQAANDADPVATVTMEWSPGPAGGAPFTKFYVFQDKNGDGVAERVPSIDLDGNGEKFVPALCISCHGGTAQPQSYRTTGVTGAYFLPFDLDSFEYSCEPGLRREDQEAALKELNTAIMDTEPTDAIRELIEGWYGGSGLPGAVQDGDFVPQGWSWMPSVYRDVIAPSCRVCHSSRPGFLDFADGMDLVSWRGVIDFDAFTAGTMPHAKVTFDRFWNSTLPHQPDRLFEVLSVTDAPLASVTATRLEGAYPNPFNPATSIAFTLGEEGAVELRVHDLRGRLVRTLDVARLSAGRHEVRWNGVDDDDQTVSSGVYLVRLRAHGESSVASVTLLK